MTAPGPSADIAVRSSYQDGTDVVWLDQYAGITGWTHELTFPGGPSSASFSLIAQPDWDHRAVYPGRLITAKTGTRVVWQGRLEAPQRDLPWQCQCTGLAALPNDFLVHDSYASLLLAVAAAITEGLPWTGTSGAIASPTETPAPTDTLASVLDKLAGEGAYLWSLTPRGVLSTPALPDPDPQWLLFVDVMPGRTLQGYSDTIYVFYNNGTADEYLEVSKDPATLEARGWIESNLDLTGLGALSEPDATIMANRVLAMRSLPAWSDSFVAQRGHLYTMGGVLADPVDVRPGQWIRVAAGQPTDLNQQTADVLLGTVSYAADTQTATLTPYQSNLQGAAEVLADLAVRGARR